MKVNDAMLAFSNWIFSFDYGHPWMV